VLTFRSGIETLEDHIVRVTGCLLKGKKIFAIFMILQGFLVRVFCDVKPYADL
jgi:hypothetical protein